MEKYRHGMSVSSNNHARISFIRRNIQITIQKNDTYLGSDLVATLASLHMDNFSHFGFMLGEKLAEKFVKVSLVEMFSLLAVR